MRAELRQYRYPLVLAVIAAAVLAIGMALKPAPRPSSGKRTSELAATRAELENLQRLVRRNSLRNLGSQFSSVAEKATDYLMPVGNSSRTAVAWSGSTVLAPKSEDEVPHPLSIGGPDGQLHDVTPSAWVPGTPFVFGNAAFEVTPPTVASAPAHGEWLVAVSASQNGLPAFRPGVFNGVAEANCGLVGEKLSTTIPLSGDMAGSGVFDLDVRLVGVVTSCDEGLAVVPLREIQRASNAATAEPLLTLYGMAVSADIATWKERDPRASGVVATEVWDSWPADVAGIEAGDLIVAIDGQAVVSEQQADSLLAGSTPHTLDVRQGRRTKRVPLQPVSAMQPVVKGASMEEPAPGVGIARVTLGSSAARAGIRGGDRILQIDGAEATAAAVKEAIVPFRAASATTVVLRRGSRRLAVVVAP